MKKILSILIAFTIGANLYAQELSDASLKKRSAEKATVENSVEQNIQTDEEFLEVFNWLMETPIHQDAERRQSANASIANYIEENPKYNVELDVALLKFANTSPDLLPIFMGGYTAYMIENGDMSNNINTKNINKNNDNNSGDDPKLNANIAGIQSVIDYYKSNETYLEKDKNVEKFIRKAEKDKLDKYVKRKSN